MVAVQSRAIQSHNLIEVRVSFLHLSEILTRIKNARSLRPPTNKAKILHAY